MAITSDLRAVASIASLDAEDAAPLAEIPVTRAQVTVTPRPLELLLEQAHQLQPRDAARKTGVVLHQVGVAQQPAHRVRFEQQQVDAVALELDGGCQPGRACPDDGDRGPLRDGSSLIASRAARISCHQREGGEAVRQVGERGLVKVRL